MPAKSRHPLSLWTLKQQATSCILITRNLEPKGKGHLNATLINKWSTQARYVTHTMAKPCPMWLFQGREFEGRRQRAQKEWQLATGSEASDKLEKQLWKGRPCPIAGRATGELAAHSRLRSLLPHSVSKTAGRESKEQAQVQGKQRQSQKTPQLLPSVTSRNEATVVVSEHLTWWLSQYFHI